MFNWLGSTVVKARRIILVLGFLVVIAGGVWGTGATAEGVLSQGGLEDKSSEGYRAMQRITQEVGRSDADVVALYSSSTSSVDDSGFSGAVTSAVAATRSDPRVASVLSYYDEGIPKEVKDTLVAKDRRSTYAVIQLRGEDDDKRAIAYTTMIHADTGNPVLAGGGVVTQLGGVRPLLDDTNTGILDGASTIEMITIPALFILLLFVFRSAVAALIPVGIAVLALMGGLVLIRILSSLTTISVFALNVLMFMALGLAVDYGLFIVSRFREERAIQNLSTADAVARTLATAGRTVFVSGITVALALSGLLVFPQAYVRSMAIGGMVAVLLAMVTSLTVLPALLAVLGSKIDAWRIPFAGGARTGGEASARWEAVARRVMVRPVATALVLLIALGALALPTLTAKFGTSDERSLPVSMQSRVVADRLAAEYAFDPRKTLYVLISGHAGTSTDGITRDAQAVADSMRAVADVDPSTVRVGAAAERAGTDAASVVVTATHRGEWTSPQARQAVADVRDISAPADADVLVGGLAADLDDQLASIRSHLPVMAAVILVVTLVFMFLAFGTVVLPPIAVVLNLASIAAAWGPIIWIFQDGHLSSFFDFTPTGFVTAMESVMMLVFAFGLSMDYSIFLLSRVKEARAAGLEAREAVIRGVAQTGSIITSAAILLAVTIGSFVLVGVKDLKFIAVGLFIIILLDATVVRMLLLPAALGLFGDRAWWAPRSLASVSDRLSLHEQTITIPEAKLEPRSQQKATR